MISRRAIIGTGGLMLAGLATPAILKFARAGNEFVDIAMNSDIQGNHVWFDPIGVLVQPGVKIRWTIAANVHTVTAYHPNNDDHSLRIPVDAMPFDSGYLVNPGDHFEVKLIEPGTYDYFCAPHEHGGMVGRIIVAAPGGPASNPFDYFKHQTPAPNWLEIPPAAQANFPDEADIMRDGIVRAAG